MSSIPGSDHQIMSLGFHKMETILEGHRGTVEEFIGVAVVAVLGVPEHHDTMR